MYLHVYIHYVPACCQIRHTTLTRTHIQGSDEVDAAVREVNRLLGEVGGEAGRGEGSKEKSTAHHSLLRVDRR